MDAFIEQVVKRKNKSQQFIIKILSVVLLILVPAACVVLSFVITPYLVYIGLFIFLAGLYAVWYVFTSQKVEFEYSVVGSDLEISKIISLRKRKKVCTVPIGEIVNLGVGEKTTDGYNITRCYNAAEDISKGDENYYAVFGGSKNGSKLLIFNPNEKILNAMKPSLDKKLMLKLFYKKNV